MALIYLNGKGKVNRGFEWVLKDLDQAKEGGRRERPPIFRMFSYCRNLSNFAIHLKKRERITIADTQVMIMQSSAGLAVCHVRRT
jgi:hypothetical protein